MDYGGSQHILTAYYVIFQLQLELLHEDMKVTFENLIDYAWKNTHQCWVEY